MLAPEVTKRQILLPSLLWSHLVQRFVYPIMILNIKLTNLMFTLEQYVWNGVVVKKLHSIKPVLGDLQSSYRRCRKDEIVLGCVHIGHTQLTHSYILKKDPPPQCGQCQCILIVQQSSCLHKDTYIWKRCVSFI